MTPAPIEYFMGTGNGSYNGNTGGNNWSESIIALNADATGAGGKPIDAYTATNFQSLDNADADLGSTAPAILPTAANSIVQRLAVQAGKDGLLRLINLANLSGQGGVGHTGGEIGSIISVPQGTGAVLTQPAVWVNPSDGATWTFVANGNGISGLRFRLTRYIEPTIRHNRAFPMDAPDLVAAPELDAACRIQRAQRAARGVVEDIVGDDGRGAALRLLPGRNERRIAAHVEPRI